MSIDRLRHIRKVIDCADLAYYNNTSQVTLSNEQYDALKVELLRLAPGGYLLTSSCSHHVDPWLFQQILFGAAKDAGRAMQIVARAGQPADHPVALHHPEGEYLKVLWCRVL